MYPITTNTATSITFSDLQCPLIVDENYWVTVGVVLASVSIILISLTIIGLCCYFKRKSSARPYLYVIILYPMYPKACTVHFSLSLSVKLTWTLKLKSLTIRQFLMIIKAKL